MQLEALAPLVEAAEVNLLLVAEMENAVKMTHTVTNTDWW
jgi:hypothetical protein